MTKQRRLIDDQGRVYCAIQRRDVDFERCLACPRRLDVDLDVRRPYVLCRVPEFELMAPVEERRTGR